MDTIELLNRARYEVQKGWIQGSYARRGGVCALGALRRVVGWDVGASSCGDYLKAYTALQQALPNEPIPPYLYTIGRCVATFNDTKGRTQAEVLALFDRAIENLAEERFAAQFGPVKVADPAHQFTLTA